MAKIQFKGSSLRAKLPRGGLKTLCDEFDKSNTWIRRILDGKELGYPEILQRAQELINVHNIQKAQERKEFEQTNISFR